MKKRIKVHIRKKCRKCGTLLVNKPEYGAVCPKCGWCRGWWTDKDEVATKLQDSCKEGAETEIKNYLETIVGSKGGITQ